MVTAAYTPLANRWPSLPERQRQFLLTAYEMDAQLPYSGGMEKTVPTLKWRTVGVMCGLPAADADEVVGTLADQRLLMVVDASQYEMVLICRHDIRDQLEAERKKRWDRVPLLALLAGALLGLWSSSR